MNPIRFSSICIADIRRYYGLNVTKRRWAVKAICLGGRCYYLHSRFDTEAECNSMRETIEKHVNDGNPLRREFWYEGPPEIGTEEYESSGGLYFNYWGIAIAE